MYKILNVILTIKLYFVIIKKKKNLCQYNLRGLLNILSKFLFNYGVTTNDINNNYHRMFF